MKILFIALFFVFSIEVYSQEKCLKIDNYQNLVDYVGKAIENVNELEVTLPQGEISYINFEKHLILKNWLVIKINAKKGSKAKAIGLVFDNKSEQIYMSYFTEGEKPSSELTVGYFDNEDCRIDFLDVGGLTVSLTVLSKKEFKLDFFQHDDTTFKISKLLTYSFRKNQNQNQN